MSERPDPPAATCSCYEAGRDPLCPIHGSFAGDATGGYSNLPSTPRSPGAADPRYRAGTTAVPIAATVAGRPWLVDAEWLRHEGATVVECPACGFCFDEGHTGIGGGYWCPSCEYAESDLARALREIDRG